MSSTVSEITISVVSNTDYGVLSTTIGLVTVLLLAVVLIGKEVARVRGLPDHVVSAFDATIVPLLPAAFVIIVLRLINALL